MSARSIRLVNLWLIAALLVGSAIVWPRLPERIPTHFRADGTADAWTQTSFLSWFTLPLMAALMAMVFIAALALTRRSPKYWNIPAKEQFLRLPPHARAPIEARLERMISIVGLLTTLLFVGIQFGMYQTATGEAEGLSGLSLVVTFGSSAGIMVIALAEIGLIGRVVRRAAAAHPE